MVIDRMGASSSLIPVSDFLCFGPPPLFPYPYPLALGPSIPSVRPRNSNHESLATSFDARLLPPTLRLWLSYRITYINSVSDGTRRFLVRDDGLVGA